MAIALVKAGALVHTTSTSITPAFGQATTAGHLLIATVTSSRTTALTCTTAGWTEKVSCANGNYSCSIWYKENCGASETAPTFKSATSATLSAQLSEWSGAATTTVADKTGQASVIGASPVTVTASAPDSASSDLAIICMHWYQATAGTGTFSVTPDTWTLLGTLSTSAKHHYYNAYRIYTAGGSTADTAKVSFTGASSQAGWVIASFKAAAGGSGKTVAASDSLSTASVPGPAITESVAAPSLLARSTAGAVAPSVGTAAPGTSASVVAGAPARTVSPVPAPGAASASATNGSVRVEFVPAGASAVISAPSATAAPSATPAATSAHASAFGPVLGVGGQPSAVVASATAPIRHTASFVFGSGQKPYFDAYALAQPAKMAAVGATAVAIDPFYVQPTRFSTTIPGQAPQGFSTTLTLTGTTAVQICTTATATGVSVMNATWTVLYTQGTDYSIVTGNKLARITGGRITSGAMVSVACDQFVESLASACKSTGLAVWLKPMIRYLTGGSWKTGHLWPGATPVTISTTSGSTTIGGSFTTTVVGRRFVQDPGKPPTVVLANSQLGTYGTTSPTSYFDGTHDSTDWCYVKSLAGTPVTGIYPQAVLSVAATATKSGVAAYSLNDTTAQKWFYDTATVPSPASWLGIITRLASQVVATGATLAGVNLVTEQTSLTVFYETEWRHICSHLRARYPGISIFCGALQGPKSTATTPAVFAFNFSHWQDACDCLGIDCYVNLGARTGGTSVAAIAANWTPYVAKMKTASAAWGTKPIMFGEIGYRSILGCANAGVDKETDNPAALIATVALTGTGYHVFTSTATICNVTVTTTSGTAIYTAGSDYTVTGDQIARIPAGRIGTGQSVKVSWNRYATQTQANCIAAFAQACWGQPWFGGFHYWLWAVEGSPKLSGTLLRSVATKTAATVFSASFFFTKATITPTTAAATGTAPAPSASGEKNATVTPAEASVTASAPAPTPVAGAARQSVAASASALAPVRTIAPLVGAGGALAAVGTPGIALDPIGGSNTSAGAVPGVPQVAAQTATASASAIAPPPAVASTTSTEVRPGATNATAESYGPAVGAGVGTADAPATVEVPSASPNVTVFAVVAMATVSAGVAARSMDVGPQVAEAAGSVPSAARSSEVTARSAGAGVSCGAAPVSACVPTTANVEVSTNGPATGLGVVAGVALTALAYGPTTQIGVQGGVGLASITACRAVTSHAGGAVRVTLIAHEALSVLAAAGVQSRLAAARASIDLQVEV